MLYGGVIFVEYGNLYAYGLFYNAIVVSYSVSLPSYVFSPLCCLFSFAMITLLVWADEDAGVVMPVVVEVLSVWAFKRD